MRLSVYGLLLLLDLVTSVVLPRQDPGMQTIPTTPNAPGTFSNGAAQLNAEPPQSSDPVPDVYGARTIDLPFYRLYNGNLKFFSDGQLNSPTGNSDEWGSEYDSANQSACGIPDNAFSCSKVAIHPYFLKFADLSRYCMQDVCISFWKEDGSSDMMLKVTDICSTDPNDPTYCATPEDIKIDRAKAVTWAGLSSIDDPAVSGNEYPTKMWWFFMKCWDDGLAQPAYQGAQNWFTSPGLPNDLSWAQNTAFKQYQNNQQAYPAQGWDTYPNGGYNPERDDSTCPPITDWVPGNEPSWEPIAGGVGWGKSSGSGAAVSSSTVDSYSAASTSSTAPIATSTSTDTGDDDNGDDDNGVCEL